MGASYLDQNCVSHPLETTYITVDPEEYVPVIPFSFPLPEHLTSPFQGPWYPGGGGGGGGYTLVPPKVTPVDPPPVPLPGALGLFITAIAALYVKKWIA